MHPNDVVFVANIVIGALFSAAVGFAVAWARTRERALRAELAQRMLTPAAEQQLVQLQHTVDEMALELERIAEAERFTARLLTERLPAAPVLPAAATRREAGTITPH